MAEQTISATSDDYPTRTIFLANFGSALRCRFEQTGSINDLNQAITMYEQAISSMPKDHPSCAVHFNNLGDALQRRFGHTGLTEDLDRAIKMNEQAVLSTPDDHPIRAMYVNNFGSALQSRFEQRESMDDLERAIKMKEDAVAVRTARPSIRIRAADSVSRLLIGRDWNRAAAILRIAVQLLSIISPRTLNQADQQHNISQFAGITSRAVSISLQVARHHIEHCRYLNWELASWRLYSFKYDLTSSF
jgi:tetratricopeptide (TPR) repeat protein